MGDRSRAGASAHVVEGDLSRGRARAVRQDRGLAERRDRRSRAGSAHRLRIPFFRAPHAHRGSIPLCASAQESFSALQTLFSRLRPRPLPTRTREEPHVVRTTRFAVSVAAAGIARAPGLRLRSASPRCAGRSRSASAKGGDPCAASLGFASLRGTRLRGHVGGRGPPRRRGGAGGVEAARGRMALLMRRPRSRDLPSTCTSRGGDRALHRDPSRPHSRENNPIANQS